MKRLVISLCLLWCLTAQIATAQSYTFDVNHDGEVNIGDINTVVDVLLENVGGAAADVNADGEVNIGDVNSLLDIVMADGRYASTLLFKVGKVPFKMIKVDGGTFSMGSNNGQGDEKPVHEVTLFPYYIGETEVTQALWKAAGCINRSAYKGSDNYPVDDLYWRECQEFIKRINALTGYQFSLPTEAQWEYAARGGNYSKGYIYAGSDDINDVAWYSGNSSTAGGPAHDVTTKRPNELGLYDMSGSVAEWCQDCYRGYSSAPQVNPVCVDNDDYYFDGVFRGGSRSHAATDCRVTNRDFEGVNHRYGFLGMRLALQDGHPVALGVSEDNLELFVDDVTTVAIYGGKGTYQATSSDERVAIPSIRGSVVYVRATGLGTATITIADDQSPLEAHIIVRVGLECHVGEVSFKMMPVEGGTFMMGNTQDQALSFGDGDDACTVHEVTLSSYSIGQTEVTQELWTAVMGYNPSEHNDWQNFVNPQGPVENVSWDECQEFIARLSELTGLTFRLPTEAEWEFAARGGNRSKHYSYSGSHFIKEVAWYRDNADNWQGGGLYGPQSVALLLPNELGLYDMSGNVWELCQDWYAPYSVEPQTNPTGPATGTARIMRGGSFIEGSNECTCAMRHYNKWYDEGGNTIGFRLAM